MDSPTLASILPKVECIAFQLPSGYAEHQYRIGSRIMRVVLDEGEWPSDPRDSFRSLWERWETWRGTDKEQWLRVFPDRADALAEWEWMIAVDRDLRHLIGYNRRLER